MNFGSVRQVIIPEGSVSRIYSGDTLLWKKEGTGPTPPTPSTPLLFSPGDVYILDYHTSPGNIPGFTVVDLEWLEDWDTSHSHTTGWFKMIGGMRDSSRKLYTGMYRGSHMNPGCQYVDSGDSTLDYSDRDKEAFNSNVKRRNLWYFANGWFAMYKTSGDWIREDLVGSAAGGGAYSNLQIPFSVGGLRSDWETSYTLYGIRIYTGSFSNPGDPVAEYIPQEQEGVMGLYNTVSGTFITKS